MGSGERSHIRNAYVAGYSGIAPAAAERKIMSDSFESTHPAEIAPFVGKHIIYTYANGWLYEMYFKNDRTIDYRVHGGMVGGRWVKGQEVHIVRLADGVYKVSWNEPTGTCVSVAYNLNENRAHGATFFPRWIELEPKKIIGFQNEKIDLMRQYREQGRRIRFSSSTSLPRSLSWKIAAGMTRVSSLRAGESASRLRHAPKCVS